MSDEPRQGRVIYCDCCNSQIMAIRYGNRIVIKDRRNRVRHVAVVDLDAEIAQVQRPRDSGGASQDGQTVDSQADLQPILTRAGPWPHR